MMIRYKSNEGDVGTDPYWKTNFIETGNASYDISTMGHRYMNISILSPSRLSHKYRI